MSRHTPTTPALRHRRRHRRNAALRLPPAGRARSAAAPRRPDRARRPSSTSSTPWFRPSRTPASSPTSRNCSGPSSTSSTAPDTASQRELDDNEEAAAPRPGRTGRLRSQIGRARTPDRPGHQPDRDAATPSSPHATMAAELFEQHTGSAWRPRAGSKVNHQHHDRSDDRQPRLPRRPTPRRNRDHAARRHPHRLLRRHRMQRPQADLGRARQGARQASRHGAAARRQPERRRAHRRLLGRNRKVAQVAFKPDWTRHAKAAPFKRNDQLLEAMPIGVIVFPGSGITETSPTRPGSSAFRSGGSTRPPSGRSTTRSITRPAHHPMRRAVPFSTLPACRRSLPRNLQGRLDW